MFSNADKCCVAISSDGNFISYIARAGSNLELHVDDVKDGKNVRTFKIASSLGSYFYTWSATSNYILIPQDKDGDENNHILCFNIKTGNVTDLTPFEKSRSFVVKISRDLPNEIVVWNNRRNAALFDAYRVNIETGEFKIIFENNDHEITDMIFNEKLQLRAFLRTLPNGDIELQDFQRKHVLTVSSEEFETGKFYNLKRGADILYASLAFEKDKTALVSINLATKEVKEIYKSDEADVKLGESKFYEDGEMYSSCNPQTFEPQFVQINYLKSENIPLDKSMAESLAFLKKSFGEKRFRIGKRTLDDSLWIVATLEPSESVKYYLFDNVAKKLKFLFSAYPMLDQYRLPKTEPIVVKSRDGLDLVCYLTRASGSESGKTTPLVAYIHGGPWMRDSYEFNPNILWLANRGYSVLQVNYRGSSGFGKRFCNALNKNFEGARNDIIDAIQWTIDKGIADKNRIAIMGESFGGYSTLAGLAFTPDFFCCGICVCGISNFLYFLKTILEEWQADVSFYKALGNPAIPADAEYLRKVSPLFQADKIKKPLLIFHGANDTRAKKEESDHIVAMLREKKSPVAYVLYPDEGHVFCREPNILSHIAFSEKFLAQFLGGWYEPIKEEKSKVQVISF